MRSRYTAYTLANIDYIIHTMRGKPLVGFDAEQTKVWAIRVEWLDLTLLNARLERHEQGIVEFAARYIDRDKLKILGEIGTFQYDEGQWFYTDGVYTSELEKCVDKKEYTP